MTDASGDSQWYMGDIVLQYTETFEESARKHDFKELCMIGIGGIQEGKPLALNQGPFGQWKIKGGIELLPEVEGVDCILKAEDGQDVGFVRFERNALRTTGGYTQKVVTDIDVDLTIKWKIVKISPGSPVATGDMDVLCEVLHGKVMVLTTQFQQTGVLSDINDAIRYQAMIVNTTPHDHEDLPERLTAFGIALLLRFDRTGDPPDGAAAISAHHAAIKLTPKGHEHMAIRLGNLGHALHSRSDHTGDMLDLAAAISAHQRAVRLTPIGVPALPQLLSGLGNAFLLCFKRTGALPVINEAIETHQRAVNLAIQNDLTLPRMLENLAASLLHRFESTGDLNDVAEAISAQQRAVQLTPDGCPDLFGWLSSLGNMFMRRYQATRELPDIHEAVSALQRAVDLAPEGHANLPAWVNHLGAALQSQYDITGDAIALDQVISTKKRAVELTPERHPNIPMLLYTLSTALQARFQRYDLLPDIDEAISVGQRGIQLTPEGHRSLPDWFSQLGSLFLSRFERLGGPGDIDEAIASYEKAVALTPEGHTDLPALLGNHANSLYRRSLWSGNSDDLDRCISLHKSAATCSVVAMRSFALMVGLDRMVQCRFRQIQETSIMVLDAAAFVCQLQQPEKAVVCLEQGRCFVWNQLGSLRTPLDDIRQHDSALAEQIAEVSRQLEGAGSSKARLRMDRTLSEEISVEDEARSHLRLAKEWEELLQAARRIKGCENFLLPSPFSSLLRHLPASGPVVVINVNRLRCDAIALLSGLDEPVHIALPHFSQEKAQQYRDKLRTRLHEQGLCAREEEATIDDETSGRAIGKFRRGRVKDESHDVCDILQGLWISVVKPILDGLGFAKFDASSGTLKPRIWWCPTGALSFLPIHAAGVYTQLGSESILDYAVSSYTPTVTALTTRVKNCDSIDKTVSGLFLTSHPNAIVRQPIPGTVREVDSIYTSAMKNNVRVLKREGITITVDECLKHMEEFSSVHLACHASQGSADPLQTQFQLHSGALDLKRGRNYRKES